MFNHVAEDDTCHGQGSLQEECIDCRGGNAKERLRSGHGRGYANPRWLQRDIEHCSEIIGRYPGVIEDVIMVVPEKLQHHAKQG